jgi:hypothetical protein
MLIKEPREVDKIDAWRRDVKAKPDLLVSATDYKFGQRSSVHPVRR